MKKQGVIKSVRKDGKAFSIDGDWFNVFAASQLKAGKGDTVEFEYTEKQNGEYLNRNVKGDVNKVGGSNGSSDSASGGGSGGVPLGSDVGVTVGHALNNAVKLAGPGAKIEDVYRIAVQVYKLSIRMKSEAAQGMYSADFDDDIPF